MKTLQDHANEIAELHWDRPRLEIHKSQGLNKRTESKPMIFYSYGLDPITRELVPLVFHNKKDWLTYKACDIYEQVVIRKLGPLDRFDFVAKYFKAYSEDFDFIMDFISAREFEKNQKLRGDTNG